MKRTSQTYYYVQEQVEDKLPVIVYHTLDTKTNEYFHEFLNRKQAQELASEEKKSSPNNKFRVVKRIETFEAGDWI